MWGTCYNNCDYFITCDDKFIKTIEKNNDKLEDIIGDTRLYNPIDFLRKEMDTMLAPVTKFVGVHLGLVTLFTGTILTIIVPFLLPLISYIVN